MWKNEVSWRFADLMSDSNSNFRGHNFQETNIKQMMSLNFRCPFINVNIRQKWHCSRILRILELKQYVNKCGYNDRLLRVLIPRPPPGIRSPIESIPCTDAIKLRVNNADFLAATEHLIKWRKVELIIPTETLKYEALAGL